MGLPARRTTVLDNAIAVAALSVRSLVAAASTDAPAPAPAAAPATATDANGTTWLLRMAVVILAQPVTLAMTLPVMFAHLFLTTGALVGDRLELTVVGDVAVVQLTGDVSLAVVRTRVDDARVRRPGQALVTVIFLRKVVRHGLNRRSRRLTSGDPLARLIRH